MDIYYNSLKEVKAELDLINGENVYSKNVRALTASIDSIQGLWILAKMAKSLRGDPVIETLYKLGIKTHKIEDLGYGFEYDGFFVVYSPGHNAKNYIRFFIPKISRLDNENKSRIAYNVNRANTLFNEVKFVIAGNEVCVIYEHHLHEKDDCHKIISHILEKLKEGTILFHELTGDQKSSDK